MSMPHPNFHKVLTLTVEKVGHNASSSKYTAAQSSAETTRGWFVMDANGIAHKSLPA